MILLLNSRHTDCPPHRRLPGGLRRAGDASDREAKGRRLIGQEILGYVRDVARVKSFMAATAAGFVIPASAAGHLQRLQQLKQQLHSSYTTSKTNRLENFEFRKKASDESLMPTCAHCSTVYCCRSCCSYCSCCSCWFC